LCLFGSDYFQLKIENCSQNQFFWVLTLWFPWKGPGNPEFGCELSKIWPFQELNLDSPKQFGSKLKIEPQNHIFFFLCANPPVLWERGIVIRSSVKYSQELFLTGIKLEFFQMIHPGNSLTT
jgi:hypothetical protein